MELIIEDNTQVFEDAFYIFITNFFAHSEHGRILMKKIR